MIPNSHLQIVKKIGACLRGCAFAWVVTGSVGMALQGVPVEVHDVDLKTDRAGAYEIERLLAEYAVRPVRYLASECIRSHFGCLMIEGILVEIMGDMQSQLENGAWEELVRLEDYRHWLDVEGVAVPVLDLGYEVEAYRRMGRMEKAEMLRAWIEKPVALKRTTQK
jgi:hypothetical protein